MKELIAVNPSQFSGQQIPTVNARDLHAFLGVRKDFSNWIKAQIKRARLTENKDYVVYAQKGENLEGGRPTTEYHLTLEAGKHVAMMSGTDKGNDVRDYFIECEKVAMASAPAPEFAIPQNMAEALRLAADTIEHNNRLTLQIDSMTPTVQAYDRISKADGMENITNTAKALQVRPKELFSYLQAKQWIYRRAGGKGWVAYQNRIQQGLLTHKVTTVQLTDGTERMIESVLVTPKGLAKLAQVFASEEVAA